MTTVIDSFEAAARWLEERALGAKPPLKAAAFIAALDAMQALDATEHLIKEVTTWHLGRQAVHVVTTELDLDTDGGSDPGIRWESTHQNDTSLHWPHGSPVDSNATRFVVIPEHWGPRHGIQLGDIGLACIAGCEDVVSVIVADLGPPEKIGEGSIALHRALGHETVIGGRIRDVGMDGPFHMVLFRESGDGHCHDNADNEAKAWLLWQQLNDPGAAEDFAARYLKQPI